MGKTKKSRRRILVGMVMIIVIAVWLGASGTERTLGLSSLLPISGGSMEGPGDKPSTDVGNSVDKTVKNEEGELVDYPNEPDKTVGQENDDTTKKPSNPIVTKPDETKPDSSEPDVTNPESTKPDESKPDKVTKPDTDEKEKVVALTFDDGPDKKYTPAILDILKEKGVKATFFVVGTQVKKDPEILQRIVDEGHIIGNHTMNHKNLPKLTKKQVTDEINEADELIEAAVGFTPDLFRAPYGALSDTVKGIIGKQDRTIVGWNVDTRDWAGTSVAEMRQIIRKTTKPNGIILMHSFGGKNIKNTVEMLPYVIDDLEKMGYTFVTADQIS